MSQRLVFMCANTEIYVLDTEIKFYVDPYVLPIDEWQINR